jgi:hypothetical protein
VRQLCPHSFQLLSSYFPYQLDIPPLELLLFFPRCWDGLIRVVVIGTSKEEDR